MKNSKIEKTKNGWQWLVNGKTFRAYAGEIHNSSASSLAFMEERVWPYLDDLNLNTVIIPIYWEQIEPVENTFDFSLVEGHIESCRKHKKKAIFLWFGLWKNGNSNYVPNWVKKDSHRFFRAQTIYGKKINAISPLCQEGVEADKKAFVALLSHLKAYDQETTVIAVQIENEMGLLGTDRDYSLLANNKYSENVPEDLLALYELPNGSFTTSFGADAPEVFMTYYYAKAIHQIAKAGKEAYDLPFFVNAWIEKYPWIPGGYPSGGPIAKYMRIWKTLVPELSALAPDLYVPEFSEVAKEYTTENNPLIVPEYRRDVYSISNILDAYIRYDALCFSVFGVEDICTPPEQRFGMFHPDVMKTLNIDVEAWRTEKTDSVLKNIYGLLQNTEEVIDYARKTNKLYSFVRNSDEEKGTVIKTDNYLIKIAYNRVDKENPKSAGIIIEVGPDEFYLIGVSCRLEFLPLNDAQIEIGILNYQEGSFDGTSWVPKRQLNGDDRYTISFFNQPELRRLELFTY